MGSPLLEEVVSQNDMDFSLDLLLNDALDYDAHVVAEQCRWLKLVLLIRLLASGICDIMLLEITRF